MKILLRVWQKLPQWMQVIVERMLRPKFRVAVAAMVFNEEGQILLFKHTYRKFEWGIPAGSLEHDEQPKDAVIREFLEESGLAIRILKLLTAESSEGERHISLVYLCAVESGTFKESDEVSEMKYFDVDALPAMLIGEKALIRKVANLLSRETA